MSLVQIRPGVALRHDAAASFRRLEAQRGRPLGVNRTTESAAQQWVAYSAYLRHLAGGPWAPLALHPDKTLHVWRDNDEDGGGTAWDTDERGADLDENGWIADVAGEAWHREYRWWLDQHRNDPTPTTEQQEDDDMRAVIENGKPDSGIIIQAGVPPYSLDKQVFDALCGAYGLTSVSLPDWQYGTVVREQWTAYNAGKTELHDLDPDDVQAIVAGIREALPKQFTVTAT